MIVHSKVYEELLRGRTLEDAVVDSWFLCEGPLASFPVSETIGVLGLMARARQALESTDLPMARAAAMLAERRPYGGVPQYRYQSVLENPGHQEEQAWEHAVGDLALIGDSLGDVFFELDWRLKVYDARRMAVDRVVPHALLVQIHPHGSQGRKAHPRDQATVTVSSHAWSLFRQDNDRDVLLILLHDAGLLVPGPADATEPEIARLLALGDWEAMRTAVERAGGLPIDEQSLAFYESCALVLGPPPSPRFEKNLVLSSHNRPRLRRVLAALEQALEVQPVMLIPDLI